MSDKKFYKRLASETIYLRYDFENAVIRMTPTGDNFVKFKGEKEFQAKEGNGIVTEALLAPKEISQKEYDNY